MYFLSAFVMTLLLLSYGPRHAKRDLRTVLTHRQKTRENVRERRQHCCVRAGCNYQSVQTYTDPFIQCNIEWKRKIDSFHIRKITFLLTGTVKSIISRSIACLNNVGPIHQGMMLVTIDSRIWSRFITVYIRLFSEKTYTLGLRTISWIFLCKNDQITSKVRSRTLFDRSIPRRCLIDELCYRCVESVDPV